MTKTLRQPLRWSAFSIACASALSAGALCGDTDTDGDGIANADDNCLLVANAPQRDSDGDGYGNACDTDLTGDGVTNAEDLGLLKLAFFSSDADADFNGDGVVNAIDLGRLRESFFAAPGPAGVARWNGGSEGNWSDAANWLPAEVPGADQHVVIAETPAAVVTLDEADQQICSLELTETLRVFDAGELTVNTPVSLAGTLILEAGTLENTHVLPGPGTLRIDPFDGFPDSGILNNVIVDGHLLVTPDATVTSVGDLLLNGTVTLDTQQSGVARLRFSSQGNLTGTGEIVFDGDPSLSSFVGYLASSSLAVGPDITIRTGTGSGRVYAGPSVFNNLALNGTVRCDEPGSEIEVAGWSVSNHGLMEARNDCVIRAINMPSNDGTIAIGVDSLFVIQQTAFEQDAAGIIEFDIDGVSPNGLLTVPGDSFTSRGQVLVNFLPGANPQVGDDYTLVMSFGVGSDTATVSGTGLPAGAALDGERFDGFNWGVQVIAD